MKPEELKYGSLLAADFVLVDAQSGLLRGEDHPSVPAGCVVQLSRRDSSEIVLTYADGRQATLKGLKPKALYFIDAFEAAGGAGLCWVVASGNKAVRLQAHLFARRIYFPEDEPLLMLVGERIEYDLPEAERGNSLAFLQRTFLLDEMAFGLTGQAEGGHGFRLLGSRWFCDVEVDGSHFECARFGMLHQSPDQPVALLQGRVMFGEGGFAARHETFLRANLAERLTQPDSYLKHWELYNDLEEAEYLERATEIGEARYTHWAREADEDAWEYTFDLDAPSPSGFRKLDIVLEANAGKREASRDGSSDLADTIPAGNRWQPALIESNQAQNNSVGEIVAVSPDRKRIKTRCLVTASSWKPPKSGYLSPSVRGDEVRLSRRRDALDKVRMGETPLRTLAALLEDGRAPVAKLRIQQAMTEVTREALGHDPTPSQRDALQVALNTPDIAIVQGPPGTGKTSVIRALVRRLAELSENRGDNADILVTSYQHDAVENALGGIDILGLPTHRIGGKRGVTDEERDAPLQDWVRLRQEVCDRNLLQMEGSPLRQVSRDVDHLIRQWKRIRGSEEGAALLLKEIVERAGPHLPPGIARQLVRATEALLGATDHPDTRTSPEPLGDPAETRLLGRLRELLGEQRLSSETFLEDGPSQARRLLQFLLGPGQDLVGTPPHGLDQAAAVDTATLDESGVGEVLRNLHEALTSVRQKVFSESGLTDVPREDENPGAALDQALRDVSLCLRRREKSKVDAVAEAVLAFREDLDRTEQVRAMIAKYSAVIAGTCQQIAGRKTLGGRAQYKVIIVDEAARANPLDLLIPMARGERVILVGDHKQLPHFLETEVKAAFRRSHGEAMTERLEISLFERLYKLFESEHRQGGPRRVVTLLDDFRMHPLISQFVSDQFYREEGVRPGCCAEDRRHGLGMYADKPVAWIDVPAAFGSETGSQSKSRPIEVTLTMREVEKVLQASDDPSLRIGVITFYQQQAQRLEEAWQRLPLEWKERVLVGTVDAFQGLEFDVVFLSTVRSNRRESVKDRVGFLAIENRLCVALSRAKRLLVVVGDAETVAGSTEQPWVPALQAFSRLCRSEEGWYEQRTGL